MSDVAAPSAAPRIGALGLTDQSQTLALALALVALAVALQIAFGMMADVSWLIEIDERWLAGAVPYRDFFEINPPASLMLYWPAVAAARALGLPSELAVSLFGFAICAASLGLSAVILQGARVAPGALVAGIVAMMILPGESFCERDHLAAVLGVPLLALALARALESRVDWRFAALAGASAGVMAAVKPPYALIGVFVALYLARQIGFRRVLGALEYYAAAAVGLAYLALTPRLFPYYVSDVLPVGIAAYLPVRESALTLLVNPGLILSVLIGMLAALTAGERIKQPALAIAGLAALGAAVAFAVQGKGWVYQVVPAMMFATLATGFAWRPRKGDLSATALGATCAATAIAWVHSLGLAILLGLAAGLAMDALSRRLTLSSESLARLGLASVIGAACGLCEIERPLTPTLETSLAKFGPGLSIGALTEDEGLGFPLARHIGAIWTLQANAMVVTAGVRRLIDQHPADTALAQGLAPFAKAERERLLGDLRAKLPDALLVGPTNTRFHAALWSDPDIENIMRDYRLYAVENRPDYPAELWLRNDFASRQR